MTQSRGATIFLMRRLVIVAALLAAQEAAADPPEQFGLVCTGVKRDIAGREEPFSQNFSIDLGAGQYCREGCRAPQRIARIEPGFLILKDDPPSPSFRNNSERIFRSNGTYMRLLAGDGFVDSWRGNCTLAEFTPFPETIF